MRIIVRKRVAPSKKLVIGIRVGSILLGLLVIAVVFWARGLNPLEVYYAIFYNAFVTPLGLAETLVNMIPLLLISVGLAMAFNMKFWNIGAEGQFLLGAMAAFWVAMNFQNLPKPVLISLILIAGFLAGAIWAIPPALLRAKLNVNEVITTLMMYYIAYYILQHMVHGPWMAHEEWGGLQWGGYAHSAIIAEKAWIPQISGTRICWPTLIVSIVSLIAVYAIWYKTPVGYEMRVVGDNPEAARCAGISYAKTVLVAMLISGGLAGIAGANELAGIQHKLLPTFPRGYGFTGIITAWLGGMSLPGQILANFFFGGLMAGGDYLVIIFKLPSFTVQMFNGALLFFVVMGEFLVNYRVRIVRR
ncbi:MAG TPA: ABC transporter permease [Candidatus Korarchaeota archaeon]|nr:ABC transporter permease [Candidatus Korarchaeota archaeon]